MGKKFYAQLQATIPEADCWWTSGFLHPWMKYLGPKLASTVFKLLLKYYLTYRWDPKPSVLLTNRSRFILSTTIQIFVRSRAQAVWLYLVFNHYKYSSWELVSTNLQYILKLQLPRTYDNLWFDKRISFLGLSALKEAKKILVSIL